MNNLFNISKMQLSSVQARGHSDNACAATPLIQCSTVTHLYEQKRPHVVCSAIAGETLVIRMCRQRNVPVH